MTNVTLPLDRGFNAAILHICDRLFPMGFDVADVAPETFEQLNEHIANTGRMLVWSGASDLTIYGDPSVNHAARAWHDWCHWKGGFDFTPDGERKAAEMQKAHLVALYGREAAAPWCRLIDAEVVGQVEYLLEHGTFPEDQIAFVLDYLKASQE